MASSSRTSELKLYASEDKSVDEKRVDIDVSNADCKFEGAQDFKIDFASYKFKKSTGATREYYDLESRFVAIETDSSAATNAAAIAQLQTDLAAEAVSRQSADTTNSNAISAEVSARATAVQAVQDALDVQEAKQETDKAAHEAAIAQEVSDRQTAVAAEAASRAADVASLQGQITAILGGALAEDLNSLSEVISAYQSGDTTLANQAAGMLTRLDAIEAILAQLTDHSF